MPKQANPLLSILKKLEALKSKSEKLVQEIANLSKLVESEVAKMSASHTPTNKNGTKKSATSVKGKKSSKISSKVLKRKGRPNKLPLSKKELSEMKNAIDNFVG